VSKTSAIAIRSRQLFSLDTGIAFPVPVHKSRAPTPGWSKATGMAIIGTPWARDSSAVFSPPWKIVKAHD
jgi:hypothetical protein